MDVAAVCRGVPANGSDVDRLRLRSLGSDNLTLTTTQSAVLVCLEVTCEPWQSIRQVTP